MHNQGFLGKDINWCLMLGVSAKWVFFFSRTIYIQWNDNDVHSVLDQNTQSDSDSASWQKQQFSASWQKQQFDDEMIMMSTLY
jgi:hypothetical protein